MKITKKHRAVIETFFNKHGKNIQFPIMSLGKIMDAGLKALPNGNDVAEQAVIEAIAAHRIA